MLGCTAVANIVHNGLVVVVVMVEVFVVVVAEEVAVAALRQIPKRYSTPPRFCKLYR